jgi:hypothetical protein
MITSLYGDAVEERNIIMNDMAFLGVQAFL